MNFGFLYASLAFICLSSVLIVWFKVRTFSDSLKKRKPFLALLTFFILFTLIDTAWGIVFSFSSGKTRPLYIISLYILHVTVSVSGFWWMGFICDFLEAPDSLKKASNIVRTMLISVQTIILAVNIKTSFAFYIQPDGTYISLSARYILYILQCSYYGIIMLVATILYIQKKNVLKRNKLGAAAFYSAIPLFFYINQISQPDIPLNSIGFLITSITIYLTTITREREKADILQKQETSKLGFIINALATDYEAVYYIDLKTNSYQNIVHDSIYIKNIAPKLKATNDFFRDIITNVADVIYPDDQKMLLEMLSKENLLKAFEINKPITMIYRITMNGTILYYHLKCAFINDETNGSKAIIGVSNIDEQMIEKQQTVDLMNAIGETYESIYQVNTINNSYVVYSPSKSLNGRYSDETVSFSDAFTSYINSDVLPEYQEKFLRYADLTFLKKELKSKNVIADFYYCKFPESDQTQYYEMRIIKSHGFNHNGKIIMLFINRNEQIVQQQRELLISSLADDYDSVSLVNLNADTVEDIRTTSSFKERHKDNNEKKFSRFNKKASMYIHPDDRAVFLSEMSPENIRNRLNTQKSFYVSYRQFINNTVLYYRLKVLRTDNWEKDSEFMIGASNVDELIRKQISLTEENSRKTSVLNALAGSYESICYINVETQAYIPFFGSDDLKQWYRTDSYRNDFSAYILANVAKEHQKALLSAVSEKNFAKYKKNAKADNSVFHSQLFKVKVNKKQVYCEFSLYRTDETHIIATIQNRDSIIRKEYEQKRILAEAKEKAEAASKAKTTFLFNMSHDIRTPMNAVKGFIELAERNLDNKEKIADYLSKAKTSGDHLLKLINDVLDMSRIESGKATIDPIPTDIRAETDKLVAILGLSAKEKGIEFTTDISAIRNNYIYSDILHVNQILLNIVSNAIKYTKPGGKVSFTIQQLDDVEEDMASYCIIVKDTGIGMSKDFKNHIYEEFARAQNTTASGIEGTGLGMSIVKRLVDMMDGAIEIESELGKGTIVQLYLSFKIAGSDAFPEKTAVSEEESLSGKKLLLVEDNKLNREIARDILEYEGLIIEEAEDGSIAVEKLKAHTPDYYDFVLMDIQMPYMNGYQATKTIRSLDNGDYSRVPIIAMTANVFEDDIKNALDAGMNGHLSKPINIPDLLNCLKQNYRKTAD